MKLSILIPMYNASAFIARCLDSLLNQDLKPSEYEILIMDDGSTDNSIDIVKNYCGKNTHIHLYVEDNEGAYPTRNKLLKKANGQFIYCLDADDYLVKKSLKPLLTYAIDNKLDFLGFESLWTEEEAFEKPKLKRELFKSCDTINGEEFLSENENVRPEIWWYIFRKGLLTEHQIKFTSNKNNADVVFTLRLLLKSKRVNHLPIQIHRYFQSSNSIMRNEDLGNRIVLANTMFDMVVEYSALIEELLSEGHDKNAKLITNLRRRRDWFLFHNLQNMIRLGFSASDLKSRIKQLHEVRAFPVSNYIGPNNSLFYKIINLILKDKRNIIVASSFFQLKKRIQL